MVNVLSEISLKNMTNRDIIASNYNTFWKSGTRHNRFASFILYESSRTVRWNNKKMVNVLSDNFTQKYANRDIIASQFHHDSIRN